MHVAAVMQLWCCWFENVQNIVHVYEGRVWTAVKGMAEGAVEFARSSSLSSCRQWLGTLHKSTTGWAVFCRPSRSSSKPSYFVPILSQIASGRTEFSSTSKSRAIPPNGNFSMTFLLLGIVMGLWKSSVHFRTSHPEGSACCTAICMSPTETHEGMP